MTSTITKISITGKIAYSDEITISQAAQIISFLNSTQPSREEFGGSLLGDAPAGKKSKSKLVESPREALEVSGAQTNPEKIVAVAAYVLQDGGDTFKLEDVKTQFRRARETAPANLSRDLGSAIAANWIAEEHDVAGEYYLTSKTDGIFDGGFVFPRNAGPGARSGKKSTSRTKASKPESLEGVDEFHATMAGFPAYSKLKSEKDRLLWIATYMRDKHERKGVSNKEVAWISDHIGTGIPSNNIAGAFNLAKNPGFAIRSTTDGTIKVTDDGVEHLKSLQSGAGQK